MRRKKVTPGHRNSKMEDHGPYMTTPVGSSEFQVENIFKARPC